MTYTECENDQKIAFLPYCHAVIVVLCKSVAINCFLILISVVVPFAYSYLCCFIDWSESIKTTTKGTTESSDWTPRNTVPSGVCRTAQPIKHEAADHHSIFSSPSHCSLTLCSVSYTCILKRHHSNLTNLHKFAPHTIISSHSIAPTRRDTEENIEL